MLSTIERFLREFHMPPTRFGRDCVRDPRLVFDMRQGRQPGERVKRRIEHFMNTYRRSAAR